MSPNVVLNLLIFGAAGLIVLVVIYGGDRDWGAGLTIGLSVGLLAAAIGLYSIYQRVRRRRRQRGAPEAAAALGLVSPAEDEPQLPFELASRGQGRTSDNVMSGRVGDGRVWVFDYTYYTEKETYNASTGNTTTSRQDHYFSCAVSELPRELPPVTILQEGVFSRMARGLGFRDVEVGWKEFDRTFKVAAEDPDTALRLLDQNVQQWLMTYPHEVAFEVAGRWILAYSKQRRLEDLRPVLDAVVGLRDQLPRHVGDDRP